MNEQEALFSGRDQLTVRALLVSERVDLRTIENTQRLNLSPMVLRSGDHGCAVLFRYGAFVLFGLDPLEEVALLEQAHSLLSGSFAQPLIEEAVIQLESDPADVVDNGVIKLRDFSLERIQIVADILAKSVVLDHYEERIAWAFDRIDPLAAGLKKGRHYHRGKELMQYIGDTLLTQQTMAGRVEVTDKPDLLWDHPELERLYSRLEDEYEIKERHLALERKLGLISQTLETLLDLLQHQRSIRVEWYIVVLILVEIMLTLYQLFIKG